MLWRDVAGCEVLGEHIPDRRALLLIHRGPSGYLVGGAGFKRSAVIQLQPGNATAGGFTWRAGTAKTADANHVAALLIVRVGIEQIVADVFEDILDLRSGHVGDVTLGVGDGGLAENVVHRQRLPRQYAVSPAEARRQCDLGIELAAQRIAD